MPLKIGSQVFLQVERVLPPSSIEDFYVDIEDEKEVEVVKTLQILSEQILQECQSCLNVVC